jgi:AcrR family transcriptional regulator
LRRRDTIACVSEQPRQPKSPSTAAGAAIVEAVLAAAEAVIEAHGLKGFTTSRVVERAGVSVGSLYQYFPSKESILAELGRRLERRTQQLLIEVFEQAADRPLAEVAARAVDAMLVGIGGLAFRRALRQEVPSGWFVETSAEVDGAVRERLLGLIAGRGDVRSGPHALMAWVIGHAIEGAVEAAVLADPMLVTSPTFRAELIELTTRYLGR